MSTGLERAYVYPDNLEDGPERRHRESLLAYNNIRVNNEWAVEFLGIGTDHVFVIDADVQDARVALLEESRSKRHSLNRGVLEVGLLVLATVTEMEDEFRRKRTLEIGCGLGKLGEALARKSRASVTFLDYDNSVLGSINRRAGARLVADGLNIPFANGSFERVVNSFSSLHWAETPVDTATAITESLRVTTLGGTVLATPVAANITERRKISEFVSVMELGSVEQQGDVYNSKAFNAWMIQDHVIFYALTTLAERGYIGVTWSGFIGNGVNSGGKLELYSAIIDKFKNIPEEEIDRIHKYARGFMAVKPTKDVL